MQLQQKEVGLDRGQQEGVTWTFNIGSELARSEIYRHLCRPLPETLQRRPPGSMMNPCWQAQ